MNPANEMTEVGNSTSPTLALGVEVPPMTAPVAYPPGFCQEPSTSKPSIVARPQSLWSATSDGFKLSSAAPPAVKTRWRLPAVQVKPPPGVAELFTNCSVIGSELNPFGAPATYVAPPIAITSPLVGGGPVLTVQAFPWVTFIVAVVAVT